MFAEVDLLTSFAPGDNFRVATSFTESMLFRVSGPKEVPTKGNGPADGDLQALLNAGGDVSPQLSVWRKFFIEQDRMAATASDGKQTATIVITQPGEAAGLVAITIDQAFSADNEYEYGIARIGAKNYHIFNHTYGPAPTLTLLMDTMPAVGSTIELFQDDYSPTAL